MNKFSKLTKEEMINVLSIIHPDTNWKFGQELDNDGKGTDSTDMCIEFIGEDTSCGQFNIHQNEEDSLRFYYKMGVEDFDISEEKGESMLENEMENINDFLNQLNGIVTEKKVTKKKTEIKNPSKQIKDYFLVKGDEDKFTKTTEYSTKFISFKSDLVDNYVKSNSDFGIGGAIIFFSLLYRKKGESDVSLIELKIVYTTLEDYFANPNILKNLNIIFLCDGEPVELSDQTAHDFGAGQYAGFEEYALLSIGTDDLIKICNSKKLEFRMSGSRGVFLEKIVDKSTSYRIKGFYNALFDNEFEVDYLIEGIKFEKEKEKKRDEKLNKEIEERNKKEQIKDSTSNSSCFVVTATMGDTNHPIVNDFRNFRDEQLLTNFFGKQFC